MMARFYRYLNKVFRFSAAVATLRDSRSQPTIPTAAVFATAFAMFATVRGSLNAIDKERHFPRRLRDLVGSHVPSGDTVGRVYTQLDSSGLRTFLANAYHRIKRNKLLGSESGWLFAAVDGHEFFCQPQTLLRPVPDTDLDSG